MRLCYLTKMRKRSISIRGHRTSILLEPEFWAVLDAAAAARSISLPALIAEVDQSRLKQAPAPGLASSLRVFALAAARYPDSGVGDETK